MKRQHSGSVIFLTEVLLALTIFALCSSVCAGLLFRSHRISQENTALNQAVILAQSGAEAFKVSGTLEELAKTLEGKAQGENCVVYYDQDWQIAGAEAAAYSLDINITQEAGIRLAEILVSDAQGLEIFRLEASVLAVNWEALP